MLPIRPKPLAIVLSMIALLSGCSTLSTSGTRAPDLPLLAAQPLATFRLSVADPEDRQEVSGLSTVLARQAGSKFPNSEVAATRTALAGGRNPVTLRWKDIWYAGLKIDGGTPLDLSPYLAGGTLEFDLKVDQLAKGGLAFRMGCGKDCERKVAYVVPGRAAAGAGWRHIALGLSCFARAGDDFSKIDEPFALEGTGSGAASIANVVIRRHGAANTPCPDYRSVSVTPAMLEESWSIDWWLPRHQAKLEEVRAMRAQGIEPQVIFIGDSITHGWEKEGAAIWAREYQRYHALDLGFSGDRTENVLWRLQHGAVDGIAPQVAVLMFGTNNTGYRREDPATTAAGVARNIEELKKRLPTTRILLLAIFPRDAAPSGKLRTINDAVNERLARLADGERVVFANLNSAFLQPDGTLSTEIMPDLLHPNQKGYAIWAEALRPHLARMLQP